jgi:predicted nucleic acid-binding protein
MIVVLVTNVIISALLSSQGAPAETIRRREMEKFGVVTSPPLIDDLERALDYPQVRQYLKLSQPEIEGFLPIHSLVCPLEAGVVQNVAQNKSVRRAGGEWETSAIPTRRRLLYERLE